MRDPRHSADGQNQETTTTTSPAPRIDEPPPLALANTIWIDRHGVHDALADLDYMHHWIRVIGNQLGSAPATDSAQQLSAHAVSQLIELRDALRRLAANTTQDSRSLGQSPVPDVSTAISLINTYSALGSVWPELRADGSRLIRFDSWSGKSFAQALITIIARQAVDLAASPQWGQLRACMAPSCAYYFLKEHRREWCSTACGNRARVARHAQRLRSS
jgi:predicted RNA-binding Zn ribbon-like protein